MSEIVTLDAGKVAVLLKWAEQEGWNPGLEDAQSFHAADPDGFLGLEQDGELLAAISVVKQNESFGFLGLYICKPEIRGTGQGWRVWQAGMKHMEGMTVGLDGVVEQQSNYAKSGFKMAWRNRRFVGENQLGPSSEPEDTITIREYVPDDLQAAVDFDALAGGVRRERFLGTWLSASDTRKTVVAHRAGTLCGFATIRQCIANHKIGPVLADDAKLAHRLIDSASNQVGAKTIIIDVPENNLAANTLVESMKLEPVFETARMYSGPFPEYNINPVFGVATLELG